MYEETFPSSGFRPTRQLPTTSSSSKNYPSSGSYPSRRRTHVRESKEKLLESGDELVINYFTSEKRGKYEKPVSLRYKNACLTPFGLSSGFLFLEATS